MLTNWKKSDDMKILETALSSGLQATISWVADLIGQWMIDAGPELDPDTLQLSDLARAGADR